MIDHNALTRSSAPALAQGEELGPLLRQVGVVIGGHCLVQGESTEVLAHGLSAGAPASVVDAVLIGSVVALSGALSHRRTFGLVPGGPAISARHPEWPGQVLTGPITRAGRRHGTLWLFLSSREPTTTELADLLSQVSSALLGRGTIGDDTHLLGALHGHAPLPARMTTGATEMRLLTIAAQGHAETVANVVSSTGCHHVCVEHDYVRVVLLARGPTAPMAQPLLDKACSRVGEPLRATLSEPFSPTETLTVARCQTDLALDAGTQAGVCVEIDRCRSAVVLNLLTPILRELPALGDGPVEALRAHDHAHRTQLCRAVLAWLDAHGDAISAAASLDWHVNTLRYRVRRARTIVGSALDHPASRLELHLRLRSGT